MSLLVCPVCGTEHGEQYAFCPECGCNLTEVSAVTVTVNPESNVNKVASNLKNQVQKVGQMAQQGIANVSTVVSDRARDVTNRASNIVIRDNVTDAMGNLVNLMINVSKDISNQMPKEMISAIDLEAEVNFVAFTIGVTIDLAELNKAKPAIESTQELVD